MTRDDALEEVRVRSSAVHPTPDDPPSAASAPAPDAVDTVALVEKFATWVVSRRLTAPVIVFLEMHRPLSFVCSQLVIMLTPFISFFFERHEIDALVRLLEGRDGVERLVLAIEAKEATP